MRVCLFSVARKMRKIRREAERRAVRKDEKRQLRQMVLDFLRPINGTVSKALYIADIKCLCLYASIYMYILLYYIDIL